MSNVSNVLDTTTNGTVAQETKQHVLQVIRSAGGAGVQSTRVPGAPLRSDPELVELCIQRAMQEYNFSFAIRPLDDLEGFLICENGYRIVVAADLTLTERIFLYLHMLAHINYNHVAKDGLDIRYEMRQRRTLSPARNYQEFIADLWAEDLLRELDSGQHPRTSRFLPTIIEALNGGISRSILQHKLHYLAEDAYKRYPVLLKIRCLRFSNWLILRLYRELATDRSTLPHVLSHGPLSVSPLLPFLQVLEVVLAERTPRLGALPKALPESPTASPDTGQSHG